MAKHKKEKFLTLILRHQPEVAGITLDSNGWVKVTSLVKGVKAKYPDFDEASLRYIVDNSEKKRFEYKDVHRQYVRACQGHSVKVDLNLPEQTPPLTLYHGTTQTVWRVIKDDGIKPMARTQVQLSQDAETAYAVGLRHGSDVRILVIDTGTMSEDGYRFYKSTNDVWLTDVIPGKYCQARHPDEILSSPYKDS